MTQTSTAAPARRADAPGTLGANVRFGIAVAVVLLVYATFAVGTAGAGSQSISDVGTERTGPFRTVQLVLEPSRLVLGIAIGATLAVMACTVLLRGRPQVAGAVRTIALTAIVVLVVAAWVAGWLWLRGLDPRAMADEVLGGGFVVPWPLDAAVVLEPW